MYVWTMEQKIVKICWIDPKNNSDLSLPKYESELASGMDIATSIDEEYCLDPGEVHLFPTSLKVAIPSGYEIQVRPRSGLAVKHSVTVINSPGTIDADYRGEIKVALINLGQTSFIVNRGDRIAQLVLAPVFQAQLEVVAELDKTTRGTGGFGHTGL